MIGFNQDLFGSQRQATEELDTLNLDKKELFDMLAHNYFLPPYQSRGVTREWLLGVHRNKHYKVGVAAMKHFEVNLTPAMTKRVTTMSSGLLVRKLNLLLASRQEQDLGFVEWDPPEQVGRHEKAWLYRMARYIDQTNLMEFFETSVIPEPAVTNKSSVISRIYHGRVLAAAYFYRFDQVKKNKRLHESLKELSDAYRQYLMQRLGVEALRRELVKAESAVAALGKALDDMITKVSMTYSSLENPDITAETLITTQPPKEVRNAVTKNCRV